MDYSVVKHILEMDEMFHEQIDYSSSHTRFYDDEIMPIDTKFCHNLNVPTVCVKDYTTTEAIVKCRTLNSNIRICALNFANFLTPGGGYLTGCHAQEETLCGDSTLYNVLNRANGWYDMNADYVRCGLFSNRAMYIPSVKFIYDGRWSECDILTVAAPDVTMCKQNHVDEETIYNTLVNRIAFIRDILEIEGVSIAILGAFGCGAFKNNTKDVANIFKNTFANSSVSNILYAVPTFDGKDLKNYGIFKEVMSDV